MVFVFVWGIGGWVELPDVLLLRVGLGGLVKKKNQTLRKVTLGSSFLKIRKSAMKTYNFE